MLTVRYSDLGLCVGDRVLDLGCGGGRHAFEAARRGARVVAVDLDLAELKDVHQLFEGMRRENDLPAGSSGSAVGGNALQLPFPDNTFDRIIASEVMEHITDDAAAATELARVLRPGGVMAVTVPSWLPEKICWALSDEYHAPFVEGGHVRIYTLATLKTCLGKGGLNPERFHRAHALHSAYWWLRCAVGPTNEKHPLVSAYRRLLTWEIISQPKIGQIIEKLLSPLLGKSVVVYTRKPTAIVGNAKNPAARSNP
ncbi:MAG: class I SAM-dependent methyltransferase [Acidimicrobiales bacterium]